MADLLTLSSCSIKQGSQQVLQITNSLSTVYAEKAPDHCTSHVGARDFFKHKKIQYQTISFSVKSLVFPPRR